MQYATVRSYLYSNRTPAEILYQAALEGDIQAFYNQLKLYPKLRKNRAYLIALEKAAEGGHRDIIDLLIELGAKNSKYSILSGASKGGHLDLIKEEVAKAGDEVIDFSTLNNIAYVAAVNNQRGVLDYILSINSCKSILNYALHGAGISGDLKLVEYLISKGANDYTLLIEGALAKDHFDIVKKYYGKIKSGEYFYHNYIFEKAAVEGQVDIVKYIFETGVLRADALNQTLGDLKLAYRKLLNVIEKLKNLSTKRLAKFVIQRDKIIPIIQYLESQGVTGEYVSEEESSSD